MCPSINTNSIVTIAAELEDGGHLIGQNSISHPESAGAGHMPIFEGTTGMLLGDDDHLGHQESAANSAEVNPNLVFDKEHIVPLPARIKSVYYINNFGLPVYPRPNSRFIAALHERDMLVFSCGSLFTSLIPCLALRGVSQAIATSHSLKAKVLLLNSLADRETPVGYTAEDYVNAISDCLNRHLQPPQLPFKASNYM